MKNHQPPIGGQARLFGIAVLLAAVAFAAAREPRFETAVPVWPKGCETEMNAFFGFRAAFVASETDRPVLRVTGCSDYRISLNGRHVGWGPARAAKAYFRVDEIPLAAEEGANTWPSRWPATTATASA